MSNPKIIEWVLRIAIAGEFAGHGVFALQGKPQWIKWFSQFGVSDATVATQLLFFVGLLDVTVALLVLVRPIRGVLAWATLWDCGPRSSGRLWASQYGILWSVGQTGACRLRCSSCLAGRKTGKSG